MPASGAESLIRIIPNTRIRGETHNLRALRLARYASELKFTLRTDAPGVEPLQGSLTTLPTPSLSMMQAHHFELPRGSTVRCPPGQLTLTILVSVRQRNTWAASESVLFSPSGTWNFLKRSCFE